MCTLMRLLEHYIINSLTNSDNLQKKVPVLRTNVIKYLRSIKIQNHR